MIWEASAPSNIALIKYMGKQAGGNLAVNDSLSWTLNHLQTFVQLESAPTDSWQPHTLAPEMFMSEKAKQKYLAHLTRMKKHFSAENLFFTVRSANNFPADCGIASSASSFAALTLCAARALSELTGKPMPTLEVLADLSRQGSGSSCRSFWPGFVVWQKNGASTLPSPYKALDHQIVILNADQKKVSSSEAHQRVQTSLLMHGRAERAQQRFEMIANELSSSLPSWQKIYEATWEDFWDMHALFETSRPAFSYMLPESLQLAHKARDFWQDNNDGPLVTMDAGANVHLLWRPEQKELRTKFTAQCLKNLRFIEGATSC